MSLLGGSRTTFLSVPWDWGRVWLAHMRQGLSHFYQRGFGMARDFGSGVSGGSFGVGAAPCSGAHFLRTRLAGACLVVGPSFGWSPTLAM